MAEPNGRAALDEAALDGLRVLETRGRTGLLEEIVRTYIGNTREQLEAIERGIRAGAFDDVRRLAHGIKSASAFVGAADVRERALALEQAARGSSPDCQALSRELALAFRVVCPLLEAVLRRDAA
jgi:two-component system sensor histidine kinase/response regulator